MNNKGLFQRLVLGAILAAGFLSVWGVVGLMSLETSMALMDRSGDYLLFQRDGTPLIAHYEQSEETHYLDLHGARVGLAEDEENRWLNGTRLHPSLPSQADSNEWDERIRSFTDGRSPHTAWHFVGDGRPDGSAYFVGYDSRSKAPIGYLGVRGFRADMPPAEECFPFAGEMGTHVFCPGRNVRASTKRGLLGAQTVYSVESGSATPWIVYILGRDRRIYEADLRHRSVRVIVREGEVRSMACFVDLTNPATPLQRIAVRTDKEILVLDKSGNAQQRYPIPLELRELLLTFAETSGGEALMYWKSEEDMLETSVAYRLFWVRPDGSTRTASVTLPYNSGLRPLRVVAAAVVPSPLVLDGFVGVIRTQEFVEGGKEPTYSAALMRGLTEVWPALLIDHLLAAGLAVLCYRRQKRYGLGRGERIAWPLFVLLLGLPGWIGYRFGRKWPVLEACSECGHTVPRDRENCLRCTNDFPHPALKGTEVFA